MLKFRDKFDRSRFLVDCDRLDLLDESLEIPEQIQVNFLKRRSGITTGLKDFRRSQDAKASWRHNRYKIMKGIGSWHKSTQGKRFHRQLSRFLATRINRNESIDKFDTLKALTSLRTHLYIESEYYKSLDEQVDFELLLDYSLPLVMEVEKKLIEDRSDLNEDELEILFRLVNEEDLIKSFSMELNEEFDALKVKFDSISSDLDSNTGLLNKYKQLNRS